jgi:hypothetical protein
VRSAVAALAKKKRFLQNKKNVVADCNITYFLSSLDAILSREQDFLVNDQAVARRVRAAERTAA